MVSQLIQRIHTYSSRVSWPVFCSIFCFTIGAWLDINGKNIFKKNKKIHIKKVLKSFADLGLWCETVIMVHELPERWKLSAILSASTQIAQIGPVFFLIGKYFAPYQFTYTRAIYSVLLIGATSCFLLAFFWNYTAFLWGKEYSVGLYILNFTLAILDGTSSVTFLPYIGGNFAKEYMIPK